MNMKQSTGKWIGLSIGGIVFLIILFGSIVLMLRIDSQEAQNIALEQVGGGEIVASEISKELLWSEYSYTIKNGDTWYEIEITGFGNVENIESGTGESWKY